MTAEIGILNKTAVALAADSAVTVRVKNGHKIYNTVNKLFSLSKFHPVGIMIFGNASLSLVPYEILIKEFRRHLQNSKFATLKEYADGFISFLEANSYLIQKNDQIDFFKINAFAFCQRLVTEISEEVKAQFEAGKKLEEKDIKTIVRDIIKKHYDALDKTQDLKCVTESDRLNLVTDYDAEIREVVSNSFVRLPLDAGTSKMLSNCIVNIFYKDIQKSFSSGIVIAGYGDEEIFPSLISYSMFGKINDKLLYKLDKDTKIGTTTNASIVPFAQKDMAQAYIEGVHPSFQQFLEGYFNSIFSNYSTHIVNILKNKLKIAKKDLDQIQNEVETLNQDIIKDFFNKTNAYKSARHIMPIVDSVEFLPKEELALMAETLVNLTLFKQKISVDLSETVGGPIDVAVISKGDGFIWMRRKHYFNKDLNHHFFSNYFNT